MAKWYEAPEVIINPSKPLKSSDIWSAGCILGELLNRVPLFPGKFFLKNRHIGKRKKKKRNNRQDNI